MKFALRSFRTLIVLLLTLVVLQASFGVYSLFLIGKTYDESPDMNVSGTMRMLTHRLGRSAMEILAGHGSPDLLMQMENDIKRFETLAIGLEQGNGQLNIKALKTEEETEILQAITREWNIYKQALAKIMHNGEQITHSEQSLLISELTSSGDRIVASIDELIFVSQKIQRSNIEDIIIRSLVVALVSTILIMFIWYLTLRRGVMEPIKRIIPGLKTLAKGGLPTRLEPTGFTMISQLCTVHNDLVDTRKLLLYSLTGNLSKAVGNTQQLMSLSLRLSTVTDTIEPVATRQVQANDSISEALHTLKQLEKELQTLQSTVEEDKPIFKNTINLVQSLNHSLTNVRVQVEQLSSTISEQRNVANHLNKLRVISRDSLDAMMNLITYARSFRTSLEPLETSLTDKQLLDLYITEQHLTKQQLHLFVLGYGQISPDELGLQSLTQWISTRGQELFTNHPRFVSLNKHYDNYREIVSRLLDSDTQAQRAENLALIENFSSMITVDLEGLSNALEERNLQGA